MVKILRYGKQVIVRFPEEFVKKLEDYCWDNRTCKTEFIRNAVMEKFKKIEKC